MRHSYRCLCKLLERSVVVLHVRSVVLLVVQLHDLAAHNGRESVELVWKIGQSGLLLSQMASQ